MDIYSKIKLLINNNANIVDFSEFGHGVSDEWIEKAEARIGIKLPPSYKWWLRNYSGGQICGEEVYSIYEIDFDEVVGGDIVYMHETNLRNGLINSHQLAICENDDETFYFDLLSIDNNGEYSIYSDIQGQYAINFIEFLENRIKYFSL
ncbi:SMI1/KNR4 family protein [Marinifilum fragile]|uniref:SMI1/KNR4 family protein n=1 Tax=Marinifilum fragile TaxID=570161 RepID=UPI002AA63B35|nr:SMI1/KNR4 family protein [Marinifilum fragile]